MIVLSVCSCDICLFVQWRHNPYISTSVGVEPTNVACLPSTATSDLILVCVMHTYYVLYDITTTMVDP